MLDIVGETLGISVHCDHIAGRIVHDRAYAMDLVLLHAHGWKPRTQPAVAIARAAADLHEAWYAASH